MKVSGRAIPLLVSIIFFLNCLTTNTLAKSVNYPIYGKSALNSAINQIISSTGPNLNLGMQISSMRSGETLYSRNSTRQLVPASILKIFTAESALLYLGANYKFSTVFVTDAKTINHGTLEGNLYLVHSGDPSLTYLDLIDLINALKAQHIQRIAGNVYIDTSAYDQETFGPGWISNDTRFCYAAPISASIINHNCMVLQSTPKTIKRVIVKKRFVKSGHHKKKKITVVTTYLPKKTLSYSGAVKDIVHYNKSLIESLFSRHNIQITGNILPGTAGNNLSVIARHDSKPLRELISQMLKKSDNIIAGSLFKKMGEVYAKQPGSWENGSNAVTEILKQKMGVNTWSMRVLDGSGLSRNNQISPSQMMQVLYYAYHNDPTRYDFISALPIAGVDGTLKHRMQNIRGKVRAKTGTMSGVVALAGYATSKEKEPIAFVIIINGRMGMGWRYKEMENKIMTALTNYVG